MARRGHRRSSRPRTIIRHHRGAHHFSELRQTSGHGIACVVYIFFPGCFLLAAGIAFTWLFEDIMQIAGFIQLGLGVVMMAAGIVGCCMLAQNRQARTGIEGVSTFVSSILLLQHRF